MKEVKTTKEGRAMNKPLRTSSCIPPHVPTRMNVSAPHLTSSSIAMAADGPPIPVDVTLTFLPSSVPVMVTYSLLSAICTGLSKYFAISAHLLGSPGRITYLPTSPGAT